MQRAAAPDIAGRGDPFELVFMDWRMPGMDGVETARRIREEMLAPPKVIMVTAYGRGEVAEVAVALGLEGFLNKPVSPSTLLDGVMQAFGRGAGGQSQAQGRRGEEGAAVSSLRGAHVLLKEAVMEKLPE